jgi:transposase
MSMQPPIPAELWDQIPPAAQAAITALVQQYERQLQALQKQVNEFEQRLNKNSTNSSLPPSSEHPHAKPIRHTTKSPRRSGGQPGHAKHQRPLLPTEQCQRVIPCVPPTCRRCAAPLSGTDPQPLRHQVWELPEIKPSVMEYQRHRLTCCCGTVTCGALPAGVPTGQAGPRLIAFSALLLSCFRQSKRRAALFLSMILNQPACPGWMVSLQKLAAEAAQPAYDELVRQLPLQAILSIDESPTKEGKTKSWIWTFVAATFTLFATRTSRAADILADWLGEAYTGVIHCDRARMYWSFGRLQWCWAHLKRDFQGLIDSPCHTARRLGRDLMRPTKEMFALWQKVRDGTLSRAAFVEQMKPIRAEVESLLLRGYFNARVKGFCKGLWQHRQNLWTFVEVEGVEPTNNAAEQALRQAVIWRKLSFGTQSAEGSRFVERLLTVVETCRRQQRNVLSWMVDAVEAHFAGKAAPSLLAGV